MNVINVSIEKLREYENNPRKISEEAVNAVARSIQEFGFKVPVVIASDYEIVCGHTRVRAAKQLEMSAVPCVVADDLTPEQIKAFRLADNKTAELSGWDFEKLDIEIEELDFDMSDFGFLEQEEIDIDSFFEREQEKMKDHEEKLVTCLECGAKFKV